jgi:hypothetical protein
LACCRKPELIIYLSIEKYQILKGWDVMLYPDLGAFEKWSEKAKMLNSIIFSYSQEVHFLSPYGESPRRG